METLRHIDTTFAALPDPTRRAILARLTSSEPSVRELAEPLNMSQPAISKHLKVLERSGLMSRGRDAQRQPAGWKPSRLPRQSAGWEAPKEEIIDE
jgi:DNA-binding transcriptional ArsR family regulator